MFKKIVLLLAVVVLSACGSGSSEPTKTATSFSWDGTWETDPAFMEATIQGPLIEISIVTDDSTSLYWKGSWPDKAKASDGAKLESKADVEALEASLMGSMDESKTFTYVDGKLEFKFRMLGTTKTVRLKR
jgi:hypothetical protein